MYGLFIIYKLVISLLNIIIIHKLWLLFYTYQYIKL